ncbi:uncharacterized protein [Nicotiana sylvestris]|uniref:uncharacterized protein n=1 Tax=Nicotiana sylvestris TaxID=4096 RepID=UPI00388C4575
MNLTYSTSLARQSKAQALADHLAENPVDDEYQPLSTYFLDEEVNSVEAISEDTNAWKMFFDGAVNARGVGIGAILISPIGQHYPATTQLRFFCTNNTAEYEACIMGMNMAIDQDVEELLIMGDLDLIIRQAQGELETRDVKRIPYRQHVEDLSKQFKSIEFRYIPRYQNELVDALATLASMLPYPVDAHINPLEIQIRERHGYCNMVEAEPNIYPWYHDIKRFMKTKEYPEQASGDQKRTIRRHASGFFLGGDVLYKRTPDLNLLRCVDAKEAGRIMYQVHSGVQSDLIHTSSTELYPMSAAWPFVVWGMDVIGPIEPKASNEHKFILVSIVYFTKWVEAITLKSVTKKDVVDFVHSNLICHFGIPATIITDNASNLNRHLMREMCEQFKIMYQNSTRFHPKANGAVEAANKNIKKILRKMIQCSRQWHKKLHFALMGYRTTVCTSVGATP